MIGLVASAPVETVRRTETQPDETDPDETEPDGTGRTAADQIEIARAEAAQTAPPLIVPRTPTRVGEMDP